MASAGEADSLMASMGMAMQAPWGPRDVLFTFVMWAVMMIGMMTATATPIVLLLAGTTARRTLPFFVLGYLTLWVGFSACAALAQWGLHEAALLSGRMATTSRTLSGAILIAVGVYQLTPLKGKCLTRCRTPLGFLMGSWREGAGGAFRMGLGHGVYCLGCCWALMGVLFVVGVMNLAWVAALTLFVLAEKLGPAGVGLARVGGVALIAAGVIVVVR